MAELYNNGYSDDFKHYDSKLCATLHYNTEGSQSCGWGCKRSIKKSSSSSSGYGTVSGWTGLEKFFLVFWSFAGIGLVWVVLKQRRMMTREDAIMEEAAMNGVGIKKRHVFPIALGVLFFILLGMFMAWKKMTWILLIGTNVGLFAQFVYLRRKAKKANAGGDSGYIKDAGLQIS
jgi:F0F1-type ATP synthase assembly protein I